VNEEANETLSGVYQFEICDIYIVNLKRI